MSRSLPVRSSPITNVEKLFGNSARIKDTYLYPVVVLQRPTTPVIYNVSTTDATATRIPTAGTNLSNVLKWKLAERDGNDFYYAFESGMATYMTGFGMVTDDTEITAIWVKRTGSENINVQLLAWT